MHSKKIKFLIDVGVGKEVEKWFINNGYDIITVRDMNPRMKDRDILKLAVSQKRMVVTMDKDFGELVYNSGERHSGVLLLRLDDADSLEKVRVVSRILYTYENSMIDMFCVYQDGKLRIRK